MKVSYSGRSIVLVERQCPFCGDYHSKIFSSKEFKAYEDGALVQDAFPNESADDREFLITGICANCWPKEED